jgi:hypothetical protein
LSLAHFAPLSLQRRLAFTAAFGAFAGTRGAFGPFGPFTGALLTKRCELGAFGPFGPFAGSFVLHSHLALKKLF